MNTNKNEKEFYFISDGPSRECLIDAFRYAYDKDSKVSVAFKVIKESMDSPSSDTRDDPGYNPVMMSMSSIQIHTIQHEDGSGHSFNLAGMCFANVEGSAMKACNFEAYYDAKRRKGTISFS